MPFFCYTAVDAQGSRVTGEAEAAGLEELTARLAASGLTLEQATAQAAAPAAEAPPAESRTKPLSRAELLIVTERIAESARAGLPLVPGLRALAEEVQSRRLRSALARMCRELEAGAPLERVLADKQRKIPPHLAELVRAGIRCGKLELVLDRYIGGSRGADDVRRAAALAIAYPLLLMLAGTSVMVALMIYPIPQFKQIFNDFGTELPGMTVLLLGVSDLMVANGWWMLISLALLGGVVLVGIACLGWSGRLWRLLSLIPWVGHLRRLVALAEFSQILSLLLECEVPLPEALQLVGQGSRDSELAFASKALAGDIEHGGSLATSAVHRPGLPHGLRQILRWSERPQTFPDLLRAASEMFESRARMQSSALVPIFEPLVIVFLGLGVGSIVIALYMPLVKLLNDLS